MKDLLGQFEEETPVVNNPGKSVINDDTTVFKKENSIVVKNFVSGDSNSLSNIEDLLNVYKDYLGSLNQEQLALLINLLFCFLILCLFLSYMTVLYEGGLTKFYYI
jgi:hypothetical protein